MGSLGPSALLSKAFKVRQLGGLRVSEQREPLFVHCYGLRPFFGAHLSPGSEEQGLMGFNLQAPKPQSPRALEGSQALGISGFGLRPASSLGRAPQGVLAFIVS